MGPGVGYIDIHLLAATALAENAMLWTGDKRLKKVASKMKLAFDE
jgi:predicted nucleic acid-binding protein